MSTEFKITVITSLYKASKFLDQFLEDIQKQTIFSDIDWYFIDAASDEGEMDKILEFQKDFKNVRIRRMRERVGIYNAWNIGVKKAKAELLGNLNVDDRVSHSYYERMVEEMDKRKDVDVIYSDIYVATEPNQTFEEIRESEHKTLLTTPKFCDLYTIYYFGAAHNCPVWRKNIHEEVGLFDEGFESSGDKEFWLRANIKGKRFKKINEPLALYYHNPEGISTSIKGKSEKSILEDQIIHAYYAEPVKAHLL